MKTIRTIIATAAVLGGLMALPGVANAQDFHGCSYFYFCAWQHADFGGARAEWEGDSGAWPSWIDNQDSSWANHGYPGAWGYVSVRAGNYGLGFRTLCLPPGTVINYNGNANDRGSSHRWTQSCW